MQSGSIPLAPPGQVDCLQEARAIVVVVVLVEVEVLGEPLEALPEAEVPGEVPPVLLEEVEEVEEVEEELVVFIKPGCCQNGVFAAPVQVTG